VTDDVNEMSAPETKRVKLDADAMDVDGEKENVAAVGGGVEEKKPRGGNLESSVVQRAMPHYYDKHYPGELLFKWLSQGNDKGHPRADKSYPTRREFTFVLNKDDGSEIFARYKCFANAKSYGDAVKKEKPGRIEFGPVYNRKPSEKGSVDLKPVERELVFDIDMTDYDDVRTCCSGADICGKCWPLMTVALKILDTGLREDFGFKHLLWVYSGRRGIHCWISDERARKLSDEARAAVAEYFAIVKGEGKSRRVLSVAPQMYPAVERAYKNELADYWINSYLPEQRILEHEDKLENVLDLIGTADANIKADLQEEFKNSKADSVARWKRIEETISKASLKNYRLRGMVEKIICWHVYPRVDIEVSKHMNHLLKGPFCVHPKTGRVCVPMDPKTAEKFDPEQVPTVADLKQGVKTLDGAIKTFNETFWNACDAENAERLTAKTRAAKASNQQSIDF
jgi:DNA primase small subunit